MSPMSLPAGAVESGHKETALKHIQVLHAFAFDTPKKPATPLSAPVIGVLAMWRHYKPKTKDLTRRLEWWEKLVNVDLVGSSKPKKAQKE